MGKWGKNGEKEESTYYQESSMKRCDFTYETYN